MIEKWLELGGVPLYDLDHYTAYINQLSKTSTQKKSYDKLKEAISLSAKPYLKKHASNEITTKSLATQCFNQIAYLLHVEDLPTQQTICTTICQFFTHKSKAKINLTAEYQPCSSSFCRSVILSKNSVILQVVLDSLQIRNGDLETECRLKVVKTLLSEATKAEKEELLSNETTVIKLFEQGDIVLRQAFSSIKNADTSHSDRMLNQELIAITSDIFFETMTSKIISDEDITNKLAKSLFDIFLFTLSKTIQSKKQRSRRNDILVILNILVESSSSYFVTSGIVNSILLLALQPEDPCFASESMLQNLRIKSNTEDFELKKLCWLFVNKITSNPTALSCISDAKVLKNFFQFINTVNTSGSKRSEYFPWTIAQREELEQLALECLANITPVLLEDFIECRGVTLITLFLQNSLENQPIPKSTPSTAIKLALKVIRQIIVLDCEPINTEFVDQGLIQMLLDELDSRKQVCLTKDLEIKSDLFMILSVLCEYNIDRKDILGESGVQLFIEYLKLCINNTNSSSSTPQQILIVYVIDCIWACIVGALTVEQLFLENSGLYLLLDALERTRGCHVSMMILGTLVEMIENKSCLMHLIAWKSSVDGKTTVLELFLKLWREASDEFLRVQDGNGIITEIFETPFAKWINFLVKSGYFFMKNCLFLKIYPVYHLITTVHEYCLTKGKVLLSRKDQLSMLYVDKYFDFKIQEVWQEITRQLNEDDKIELVDTDKQFLKEISEQQSKLKSELSAKRQELEKEMDDQNWKFKQRLNVSFHHYMDFFCKFLVFSGRT